MGVHGLWELLAPVGRRVSVETLAGKKLAIDASIWMIQFMKAMRDERGEMVSNAHILGFFRRICKLLFLRTKPVFVFDGGTPALKRRTVAARRRHRENARAKIRKTAEKLLLNHLKSKKLEELAEEIKSSKSGVKDAAKGKQVASVGDERRGLGEASSSGQSHQGVDRAINQESLDELLAASIAAEEEGKLGANVEVPNRNLDYEVEGDEYDDDEEMIFPVTSDNVDPAVLASLPPSMQLNLLDQMRERLMAENRQKYQKIKKVPAKFSELQIQSYLKTVAFRREINEVQKSAAGRGVGGLQTSRIASEANREYIFSSSFTGDKQMLNLSGVETNRVVNQEKNMTAASDAFKNKLFMSQLKSPSKMSTELATKEIGQDVETYLDDRGRVRVSRVRGLGIRMTRDLQRNLDLMKEYDQVFVKRDLNKIQEPLNNVSDFPKGYSQTKGAPSPSIINEECNLCSSVSVAGEKICEDMTTTVKSLPVSASGAAIEISFSEDENESKTMTDSFFMNLVFGNQTSELFSDCISLEKNVNEFESECIWEDGKVGEQSLKLKDGNDKDNQSSFGESKGYVEDEVEWEEDASIVSHSVETEKAVSQGLMEEEADLQEAIRRSLEDITAKHCSSVVPVEPNTTRTDKNNNLLISVKHDINIEFPIERNELQSHPADCVEEGSSGSHKEHPSISSQNEHLPSSVAPGERSGGDITLKYDKNGSLIYSSDVVLPHDARSMEPSRNKHEGMCKIATDLMSSDPNLKRTDGLLIENCPIIDIETTGCKGCNSDTDLSNAHDNSVAFLSTNSLVTRSGIFFPGARPSIDFSQKSSIEQTVASIDGMQELVEDDMDPAEGMSFNGQNSVQEEDYIAVSETNLDDEISLLKQERANLGEEQRKLERNAESVSSEMFAECQELLQMFGLPYIISPMEAEAQCAYMEMSNLVDGIVTDDSDVFLFGARNVYKNIFDDRKYVETYFMKDIENELGLTREKLIHMALLLGSDYTVGVSGIGIVNAIEVVNTFPEEDGLLKFKEWVESPDPNILGLHGSHCGGNFNKKSSNTSNKTADEMENNVECSGSEKNCLRGADDQSSNSTISDAKKEAFMDKHRNVSKNWHFPPSFPSDSVISAYISPQIDESSEPFAWGKPDLHLLRKICWEKFGWPNQKADELLVPVLKEYNKHETQLRMEAFYSFNERFAKIRSQRIKKAIKGITGTCSSELTDYGEDNLSFNRKRGVNPCMNEQSRPSNDTYRSTARERKSSKLSRSTTQSQTPNASAEPCKQVSGSDQRGQVFNAKTRGGGQSGRGRRKGRGKGKGSEDVNDEFTESCSDDEWRNMIKMQKSTMTTETEREMRRSTRPRKKVSYAENNAEINELGGPIKTTEAASLGHEAVTKVMAFGNDGDNINQEKMVLQDYLYIGGSFCLGENETQDKGQPSPASSMKYSFEQNQGENQWPQDVSRSLVSGGGFCMDESDPGPPAFSMSLPGELDDASYHQNGQGSDFGSSEQYDSIKQYDRSDLEDLKVIEKGDSSVEQHQHMLSAMSSLKRKRKKG